MAWNPSPEVAVARDAAKKLDDAPIAVVVFLTNDGRIGFASYGRTMQLCKNAKSLGEHIFNAAKTWGEMP
jgi:hypothetical protein